MSDTHPVQIEESGAIVRAMVDGATVAETCNALLVHETGHGQVWYFPVEDVRPGILSKTSRTTHCPRKGNATYWTISLGSETLENAAWSYETPFAQVEKLKGYVSFYTQHVDVKAAEDKHAG